MSELSTISFLIGLLALVIGGFSLLFPTRIRAGIAAFPRSVWPGRILAGIDLIWVGIELSQMHLGRVDAWKVNLYWLVPIAIFLCINYLDELLSPRALGGLLLLMAGPLLNIARWNPSNWRLVIIVIAYLWILIGMLFLLSPWWFRRLSNWVVGKNDRIVRYLSAFKILMGLCLIALALFSY